MVKAKRWSAFWDIWMLFRLGKGGAMIRLDAKYKMERCTDAVCRMIKVQRLEHFMR